MQKQERKQFTTKLNPELAKEFRIKAIQEGKKLYVLMEEIVREYFERKK